MKDDIKNELDAIFKKKDEATARADKVRSEQADRGRAAVQEFARLAEVVIKPAMEQFAIGHQLMRRLSLSVFGPSKSQGFTWSH